MFNQPATIRDKMPVIVALASSVLLIDCSSDSGNGNEAATGGSTAIIMTGGSTAMSTAVTGGAKPVGGATSGIATTALSGGATSMGGMNSTLGGASSQAGSSAIGGANGAGGATVAVGGITSFGGNFAAGGTGPIDGGNEEDGGYLEDGGEAPTFTMIYNEIISSRCTTCHVPGGAGVTAGKLDMSTKALAYADLVGPSGMGTAAAGTQCQASGLLRVTPGEHATSLLWQKVNAKLKGTSAPCGNPMPLGSGGALSQAQVDQIADWIDSGAIDD